MQKPDGSAIQKSIAEIFPAVVRLRRRIHAYPELSGHEQGTAALIETELRKQGITTRCYLNRTAVVGTIRNGSGKTVVLRADTDALPIGEKTGFTFASKRPGVMHACGHDLHTAILLGAAKLLVAMRESWRGTVVLLFQPSEEMEPGGARGLIKKGAFPSRTDAVFGLHADPDHSAGQIGLIAGADLAGVLNFSVAVRGRGGHAAIPQDTVNPIVCAAAMISGLHLLTNSKSGAVLSVGTIASGIRSNIIPDEAVFAGTIRTHARSMEENLRRQVRKTVAAAARAFGAEAAVTFESSYPPTWNDPRLARRISAALTKTLGRGNVIKRRHPIFYAEDFSYYQQRAPGLFAHLGVRPRGSKRSVAGLHSAAFSPDEESMKTGMLAHAAFVMEMLGCDI
jgi:amidohydrolase